jgi:hypothetical protein
MIEDSAIFLQFEVGNPHFRGKTLLRLYLNGQAEAHFIQGDQEKSFFGKLNIGEMASLEKLFQNNPPHLIKSTLINIKPDDDEVKITVHSPRDSYEVAFRYSEQWQSPNIKLWIDYFQSKVSQISAGKIVC